MDHDHRHSFECTERNDNLVISMLLYQHSILVRRGLFFPLLDKKSLKNYNESKRTTGQEVDGHRLSP